MIHVERFRFLDCTYDTDRALARLRYAFDDSIEFVEELTFRNAPPVPAERLPHLDACLRLLHQVAGVSYYKAAIPAQIVIENGDITRERAEFLRSVYVNGLGEFAFRNGVADL